MREVWEEILKQQNKIRSAEFAINKVLYAHCSEEIIE